MKVLEKNTSAGDTATITAAAIAPGLPIQRDKARRVVLYQYLTRSGSTTSEYRLKLEMIKNSLLGRPLDAAFVRYSTPIKKGETETEALERLSGFARRLSPDIKPALPF